MTDGSIERISLSRLSGSWTPRPGRWRVELDVEFSCEHNVYVGLTNDVGEGGIFVATHHVQPIGTELVLQLRIPGHDEATLVGEVRWVRPPGSSDDVPPGMGIRLSNMPPSVLDALREVARARDPILYDE